MRFIQGFPEAWKFGTREVAVRGTPLTLWANLSHDAAAARYSTLFREGTQAGYLVPAGRVLLVTRIRFANDTGAVGINLLYGTTDVGQSSAAAPAAAVILTAQALTARSILIAPTAHVVVDHSVFFRVPAANYLAFGTGPGGTSVSVFLVDTVDVAA